MIVCRGVGEVDLEVRRAQVEEVLGLVLARPRRVGRLGDGRHAGPDRVLLDVDHHHVGRPELEEPVVVHPDPGDDLGDQLLVVRHVRDHAQARLDLVYQVAGRVVEVWAVSIGVRSR